MTVKTFPDGMVKVCCNGVDCDRTVARYLSPVHEVRLIARYFDNWQIPPKSQIRNPHADDYCPRDKSDEALTVGGIADLLTPMSGSGLVRFRPTGV